MKPALTDTAHKRATLERLRKRYKSVGGMGEGKDPEFQMLTVYHGLGSGDMGLAEHMCNAGIAVLPSTHRRNLGWFGDGVYFTTDLDFARAYAQNTGIVLVCNILLFQPYPVTDCRAGPKNCYYGKSMHMWFVKNFVVRFMLVFLFYLVLDRDS